MYLLAAGLAARSWQADAWWPVLGWTQAWHDLLAGRLVAAFVLTVPVAILGRAGRRPVAAAGLRHRDRAVGADRDRAGRVRRPAVAPPGPHRPGRLAVPATVPLLDARGQIVMGATIRAIGHRWQPVLTVSPQAMGRHQVVIGASGAGKTKLMIRSWAGWYAATLAAHHATGSPRLLLAVVDCKGGPDARLKAPCNVIFLPR